MSGPGTKPRIFLHPQTPAAHLRLVPERLYRPLKRLRSLLNDDRKAILIAGLCLVHCIAGPLLLTIAGFASMIRVSERFEPAILLSSAAFGAASLVPAYRTKHRRRSCLALFCGGLFCLLFLRHAASSRAWEMVGTALGATLIIGAHALNLRFSRRCACCNSEAEAASSEPRVRRATTSG